MTTTSDSPEAKLAQLRAVAANLEAQRSILGSTVDAMLAPLLTQIAALEGQASQATSAAVQPLAEERKIVTVLFADVSGFTAMSETLDAEEVADTIGACWQRLDGAIIQHQGRIDKHIGDAVMAVWGIPRANENDPTYAVRAALALQRELAALSAELAQKRGISLRMRVGINTGPVLAGRTGTTAEYTVIGDAVNLASRLEHAAPVGGVLIGHTTYRRVRGLFDVQAQQPLTVRGKAEPVRTYLVVNEKTRPFRIEQRGIEGVETHMIGRDTELAALQTLYANVGDQKRPHLALVVGEAGLGKSRLLYELANWLEVQPGQRWLLRGRARAETVSIPFYPWRVLWADHVGLADDEPPDVTREKFERGVIELWGTADEGANPIEATHTIGYLIGIDWPDSPHLAPLRGNAQMAKGLAFYLTQQLLTRLGAVKPIVMLLEDLHWADSGTLELIDFLLESRASLPLLMVGATRPDLLDKAPRLCQSSASRTPLYLQPLSADAARALVLDIFHHAETVDTVPTELVERVIRQSEGNPYYLEELIKMLIERGVIAANPAGWQVFLNRLADVIMPDSLQGLLQARLDALAPHEKSMAQRAAVVGRIFWSGAVAATHPETDPIPTLQQLTRRTMVYPRETSTYAGENEYIFKHALLRDVAYETLPKKQRRVYHAQVARWLESMTTDDPIQSAQVAEHYEQAEDRAKAVALYRQAAQAAAARFANREAVELLGKALNLTDDPIMQFELTAEREGALDWLGLRAEQRQDIDRMLSLAQTLQSPAFEAQALNREANWLARVGESAAATAAAERALQLARQLGLRTEEAQALRNLGDVSYYSGQWQQAVQSYQASLQVSKETNDCGLQIDSLNRLGATCGRIGNPNEALHYYERARQLAEVGGDDWRRVKILSNSSILEFALGRYQIALAHEREVLALQRKMGNRHSEAIALNNLGAGYQLVGQYVQADEAFQESIKLFTALESPWGMAGTLSNQALSYTEQGQNLQALLTLEEAQNLISGKSVAQDLVFEIINRRTLAYLRMTDLNGIKESLAAAQRWLAQSSVEPNAGQLALMWSYRAESGLITSDTKPALEASCEAIKLSESQRLAADIMRYALLVHARALSASGEPQRAGVSLEQAMQLVEQSAQGLDDTLRESFLHNVSVNRMIIEMVEEAQRRP